jgi:hypothetical protein
MEFDPKVYADCFARAFNLLDAKDPTRLNRQAVSRLANEWLGALRGESIELLELKTFLDKMRKASKEAAEKKTGFNGPALRLPGAEFARLEVAPRPRFVIREDTDRC